MRACVGGADAGEDARPLPPPSPTPTTSRRAALAAGVILPGLASLAASLPAAAADATAAPPALVDAAVAAGLPPQADTITLKGVGTVTALGIGAWSWGDRTGFWGWQSSYGKEDVYGAYRAAMDAGISRECRVLEGRGRRGEGGEERAHATHVRNAAPALGP